ncbi:MAG: tetratricopeptide repeat protein [Bacteroidetes bacterium]|nr:tetratricopeptide repeat protein [Bacteroidota bacterium]
MKIKTILFFFFCILINCSQNVIAQKTFNCYNNGLENYSKGNYELALSDFNSAIRINPDHSDAYYYRGLVYSVQKKFDLAISDYTNAIKYNNSNTRILYARSLAFLEYAQFYDSICKTKFNPNAKYKEFKKNVQIRKKYEKLSEQDLKEAIEINKKQNLYLEFYKKGKDFLDQDKFELAIDAYTSSIKLNPNYAEAYIYRGFAYGYSDKKKKKEYRLSDWKKAADLGSKEAKSLIKKFYQIDY